jgi:squalene-hopene/tetraprenyl-beta-curcumene cyclase
MVLAACEGTAADENKHQPDFLKKGCDFLLQHVRPDGGIYSGTNYQNYNTSWSLMALAKNRPGMDNAVIQNARRFAASWQVDLDGKGKRDNPLDGGIGYGDGTPRANLANTLAPLRALHETQSYAAANEPKLNREMLLAFVHHCQNFRGVNREAWVTEDPDNRGGFIYYPGKSFAGEVKLPSGQTGYRSYGSMTYAGLLCCFYAGVGREMSEVQSALDWVQRHFSVEENPAMGQQGLFYYYQLMADTLSGYGIDQIERPDGSSLNWRESLGRKLVSLQKADGSWVNPEGRWMEDNPVICTAYALMALNAIARKH